MYRNVRGQRNVTTCNVMVVHHAQLLKTGIPSNAVGQQLVQQVQFNATQSAIKVVGIWFELQNGIVPTS
jgi:hypothetical protein